MSVEAARISDPGYVFEVFGGRSASVSPPPTWTDGESLAVGRARVFIHPGTVQLGDEPTAATLGSLLVVVQGCLDYRHDLGFSHRAQASSAEIVAEAFSRWGLEIVDRLEGDFACVVWDEAVGVLLAHRTFPGPYPLFYSESTKSRTPLVLSSSISGVLAHPDVDSRLNVAAVAEAASGLLFGEHGETCRSSVRVLDPGWALVQRNDADPQRIRTWKPVVDLSARPRSEGAEELMELIRGAVGERASEEGSTAIWLSGGFDSSAVFAAAMSATQDGAPAVERFTPVSISYPEGDVAREDDWIQASVRRWSSASIWLDSEDIPVRLNFEESATQRDEPFVHLFDTWNAALATASHASGARVALGGDGGDQLFQAPPIHLADLARTGHPIQLLREFRAMGGRRARTFAKVVLAPLLPRPIARIYEGFSGVPFQDTQRIGPPPWLRKGFVKRHALLDRNRELRADHLGSSRAAREVFRMASSPFYGRVVTEVRRVARTQNVLHRSPLWDRRIAEFALRRPFAERLSPGESKTLLRESMQGLIPDEVLAPRPQRTGAPDSVYHRFIREGVLPTVERLGEFERLADLGILEPRAYQEAVLQYKESPQFFLGVQIALSVDTECWLRGLA